MKKLLSILLIILLSSFLFADDDKTVITIENARNTQYEKDKKTGNDVIILTGNVKLSVERGSTKSVIGADSIRYDRVTDMIFADGNVSLEQTDSTQGGQTVTAESLMFNSKTLEGVFDDGRVVQTKSNAINLPSDSTLIVSSDIFGRSQSNTIAFKDGVLTFCDDLDPHWKIKANRIWLLPGGEFSFFNAWLYVGPVPVMYLPAFYYPKDELIFNPVFGYRQREGTFIQNTIYVFGRKPLDTSSSTSSDDGDASEKLKALFNFVKPSALKDQKLEGLILHNLDTDYTGNTSNYVKVTADYYANLGIGAGIEGVVKPKKYLTSLEFGTQLGFSNTIFNTGATYYPYSPTGQKYMDHSSFLGINIPFRYGTKFKATMTSPLSLTIDLPLYSDPYFKYDFSDRAETMDWISYAISSSQSSSEEVSQTTTGNLTWSLTTSYTVPVKNFFKPYLSTLSFSTTSNVSFLTKDATEYDRTDIDSSDLATWKTKTPERKFYYPSTVTPCTLNMSIGGTLISYTGTTTKSKSNTPSYTVPLVAPEDLDLKKDSTNTENKDDKGQDSKGSENPDNKEGNPKEGDPKEGEHKEEKPLEDSISNESQDVALGVEDDKIFSTSNVFPKLSTPSLSTTTIPGITYNMSYTIKPYVMTQIAYANTNLNKSSDFDWKNYQYTKYDIKIPVTLNNAFTYGGSFFSINHNYAFNPTFYGYGDLNRSDTSEGGIGTSDSAYYTKKYDAYTNDMKRDLTNTNSVSLKPFCNIPLIKDTGITYSNTIKMVRTEFDKTSYTTSQGGDPKWIYHGIDWDDPESITSNALDLTLACNELNSKLKQSFTLTTTLKPLAESYYGTLALVFPYTTLSCGTGIAKKSTDADAEWVKKDFTETLKVSGKVIGSTMSFTENFVYNLEDDHHSKFSLSFDWYNLSCTYTASYTTTYSFDKNTGWTSDKSYSFEPYSVSLKYSPSTVTLYRWKNRVTMGLGLTTSLNSDLIRPTQSSFVFSPSLSFKIHDFVTLSLKTTSQNQLLTRYFGNEYHLEGETNIFKDLINSFRFDDDEIRKTSGFKLKSFEFTLDHEMHDWTLSSTLRISPREITGSNGNKEIDFTPYASVSILWKPMSAMKTQITDEYGTWKLE